MEERAVLRFTINVEIRLALALNVDYIASAILNKLPSSRLGSDDREHIFQR